MSAAGPTVPTLGHLPDPRTIEEAASSIEDVIKWAVAADSHLGYFAVLYKRVTLGIRDAINDNVFDDGPRMERLDIAFAQRYFDALNGYFNPSGKTDGLTLPWEVSFVGDRETESTTMLQHMMAGLNAHITFDLALALIATVPTKLDSIENDFARVNALLCSQIPGMLDAVEELSPTVRTIRKVVPFEVTLLKRMLTKQRKSAWLFAIGMALNPGEERERRVNQASWTAALGAWYLHPPPRLTAFPLLVRAIARKESRDVGANVEALDRLTGPPARMSSKFLLGTVPR